MQTPEIKPKRATRAGEMPGQPRSYMAQYDGENMFFDCLNMDDFISEVFEYSDEMGEDPHHIITPEYGRLPYVATLFHFCFAEGSLALHELIHELKNLED